MNMARQDSNQLETTRGNLLPSSRQKPGEPARTVNPSYTTPFDAPQLTTKVSAAACQCSDNNCIGIHAPLESEPTANGLGSCDLHVGNQSPSNHTQHQRSLNIESVQQRRDLICSSTLPLEPKHACIREASLPLSSQTGVSSFSSYPFLTLLPSTTPLVNSMSNSDLRDNTNAPLGLTPFETLQRADSPHDRPVLGSEPVISTAQHVALSTSGYYQAHQPRRCVAVRGSPKTQRRLCNDTLTLRNQGTSLPLLRTHPYLRRHSAPMIGPYEESILLGRMSTQSSKPFMFTAQVGVLARGQCPEYLDCPPHVDVEFPAVFYAYQAPNDNPENHKPSPYVGVIDVERYFPAGKQAGSPKFGCYAIPPKGQLQVIIKSPNKVPVKIFLIPYDLSDMPASSKTVIRQRSSALEKLAQRRRDRSRTRQAGTTEEHLDKSSNHYPERLARSADKKAITRTGEEGVIAVKYNNARSSTQKSSLRYLIQFNVCCTPQRQHYMHGNIRVIFSNRVPDGKERLRLAVSYPEPKYTACNLANWLRCDD